MAFEHRFLAATPFGVCVGVSVPPAAPVEGGRLEELHAGEKIFARDLHEARRATWIAGRLALREALEAAGLAAPEAILATDRGAPRLPPEVVGSISHKKALAVALVSPARSPTVTIGIDLEEVRLLRVDVAERVLTEEERAALPALGPARDAHVLRAFCAKEAIYKALDPWVRRFVGFHEAQLAFDGSRITARLTLAHGEGPFAVDLYDASHLVEPGHFMIAAAIGRPVST